MNGPQVAILAAILASLTSALLFAARRKMVAFEIRIRDGEAILQTGLPPAPFLSDVQEIATRNGVERATVLGVRKGRRIQLLFHGSISKESQQQVRNAWSVLR